MRLNKTGGKNGRKV